ncbi:DUF4160 domain-containing protein [Methylobacter sp.]|uniref:DUF4160 domain-containing protein n=1 Tax=Methylobacter sp. TaxID=2051955 RepID=UPI0025E66A03|nr:DUF4160 domain-containing protein [Methylobacter sp.]
MNAPPHFHAKYGEYEITVNILAGVVEGKFPKRALHHVLEWYDLHHRKSGALSKRSSSKND